MEINKLIAKRIRLLLKERKFTIYKLSTLSGVPNTTLNNILHAKCKGCNIITINNICRGFGISVGEFFMHELFAPENIADN